MALAGPLVKPLGNWNLLLFFVVGVGALVLLGLPIAFSFGLATFGYIALTTSTPTVVVVGRMDEGMSHLILLAVPLFVLLGLLIEMTGIARAMVNFLANLLGHVRGGLSYVLIGAMYLVSGISGSKAADMAAVAPALFPEMRKRGAKPGDLVALLSATGAQTETIPPSLVLITIGSATGVSIAALFTGGLLPGVVVGVTLAAARVVALSGRRSSGVSRAPGREIGKSLLISIPHWHFPSSSARPWSRGVATATEVSTIGIVYAVIAGLLVYRQFDWKRVYPMLVSTAASRVRSCSSSARDRHGLGSDPVGFSTALGGSDEGIARRRGHLHGGVGGRLHHPRLGARGHPRHRAAGTAAVPHRSPGRHPLKCTTRWS
jgi:tripartite ATP-independent transporter DctM subunit